MEIDPTPRNVAKYIVKYIVAAKAAQIAENLIVDHTRFEDDNMFVEAGTSAIGWVISNKMKPLTDRAVDKTADYIVAKREARRSNKNKPDTEK